MPAVHERALGRGAAPLYDAFLSYSHAADGGLAPALQQGLQQLAKPWYRSRALRVFRDQANLAANPDLWTTVESALQRSRHFVLMASPEAAASPWVRREVAHWKTSGDPATFLIVVTGGAVVWNHAAGDFDPKRTTALPPELHGWFRAEPLWVAMEWAQDEADFSLRHGRFRDCVATVAAAVHGRPKDELDSEDVRRHRTAIRLRWSAVGGLIGLTAISGGLTFVADQEADRARASLQRTVARDLLMRSRPLADTEPAVSKLLTVAGWRLDPTAGAHDAMRTAVDQPGIARIPGQTRPDFSRDGSRFTTRSSDDKLHLWDFRSRTRLQDPKSGNGAALPGEGSPSLDDRFVIGKGPDRSIQVEDPMTSAPVGPRFVGHAAAISDITVSPDERTLATSSYDGTARLWDIATRTQIGPPLTGHAGGVDSVIFSPDGRTLATGSFDDQTVRLWDVASHAQVGQPLADVVAALTFSPDGRTVATASLDDTIQLWDTTTHRPHGERLTGHTGRITSAAFSPDGGMLATASGDHTVRLWRPGQRQVGVLTGSAGTVSDVQFSPDGRMLATSSFEANMLRLWDTSSYQRYAEPRTAFLPGGVDSIVFGADGRLFTAVGQGRVQGWDTAGESTGPPIPGSAPLAITADGRTLVTAGTDQTARKDHTVHVWDTRAGREIGTPVSDPASFPTAVAVSPDGRVIATAHHELIRLWDVSTRRQLGPTLVENRDSLDVDALAFSPDGRTMATGGVDGVVRLWDVVGHRQTRALYGHAKTVTAVAFGPDGRRLVSGSVDHTVRLWDAATGAPEGPPLLGHTDMVGAVAVSPDGQLVASGSMDRTTRFWDVSGHRQIGDPLGNLGMVEAVAFSPDGRTLATGDPMSAQLWQVPATTHLDNVLCGQVGRSLTPEEWRRFVPAEIPYQRICR